MDGIFTFLADFYMSTDTLTYLSDSHEFGAFFSKIKWQLTPEGLLRATKKGSQLYPYSTIDYVRLQFHIGGRTTPSRYCCYFSVNGKSGLANVLSITKDEGKTTKGQEYTAFVTALIERAKRANTQFKIHFGYSWFMWRFNMFILLILFSVLGFVGIYNYRDAQLDRERGLIFLALLFVFLIGVGFLLRHYTKFYPRELQWHESIPESVLPAAN